MDAAVHLKCGDLSLRVCMHCVTVLVSLHICFVIILCCMTLQLAKMIKNPLKLFVTFNLEEL